LISGIQWECMPYCVKEYWMVFLNVAKCTDKFPSWAENDLVCILVNGWSQWSCSLRHDLSMPTQTLGLGVQIPLKLQMLVFVYSVFV
jgi:hypothetical protein